MSSWTSKQNCQELFADRSVSSVLTTSGDSQGPETGRLKERRMSDSATQTGKSLQSGDSGTESGSLPVISSDAFTAGWSPSDVCRLSTPPSSQMSPSTSNPDLLSSLNIQSHCSTPGIVYTPGQSPTTSLGGDIAYQQGYSSSPSVTGSRGKSAASGWMYGGRGTPVRGGKAASHDGQLTRALYSMLAEHSSESAPAAIGEHQTSTPRDSLECEKETIEGAPFDRQNSLTFPSSNAPSTFEVHEEEVKETLSSSSTEQFHSGNLNISPKEEYRDFSSQEDCATEIRKQKSVESCEDVISSDFMPDSLTPVDGQSLDTITLSNTPSDLLNVSTSARTSTETHDTGTCISQAHYDSDVSLTSKELNEQQLIETDVHMHKVQPKLQEKDKSETSLKSDEVSSDFSKFHGATPSMQQNHHPLHACDLIAAFPQLLPLFRSEQEHIVNSSMADGDDITSSRLQQQLYGTSPVEILDNYLKTGKSIHYGELSR